MTQRGGASVRPVVSCTNGRLMGAAPALHSVLFWVLVFVLGFGFCFGGVLWWRW
jgi:hypothetical protein